MKTQLRLAINFCKSKVYIERFQTLQSEVARLQSEVIQKKDYLERMHKAREMTFEDTVKKVVSEIINLPYESKGMASERLRKERLLKELEDLENENDSHVQIVQRHKKEEQARRETLFLTDLARFNLRYEELLRPRPFPQEVQAGLQLSSKALAKALSKEGVQWLGAVQQPYDPQIHQGVQGQGEKLKQVVAQGFKVKSKIISKAKVTLKQ